MKGVLTYMPIEVDEDQVRDLLISDSDDDAEQDEAPHELEPVSLDADTFGMSVCSLTRDSYFIARYGMNFARGMRLFTSLFLVTLTIVVQIWLLMKVKQFVTAKQVHDIRNYYDKFELAMYGEENCTLTVNGKHRGIRDRLPPPDVQKERLYSLSEDDRDQVCRIPLSQPYFFGLILLIWTLTCVFEFRKAWNLQVTILMLKKVDTMEKALQEEDEEEDPEGFVIKGMTNCFKVVLTLLTFIPRIVVCLALLWLGCRWLLATFSFSDLILNAVALEFIMMIKEVVYNALMPFRNQIDLDHTKITAYPKTMPADAKSFVDTLSLLVMALLWILLYMGNPSFNGIQAVLPEYNWDVHNVCVEFIKERYKV